MENESESGMLETTTAILIAIVVAIIALVSWRASVIDDSSGDYDYAGLRSTVYAVRAEAIDSVNAYESYGNYVNYLRNKRMGELIAAEIDKAPEADQAVLTEQMKVANDLADANNDMFPMKFMNRDGTYSVKRQMGTMWADAAKENDLDYTAQFKSADKDRASTRTMLISVMVLSIATVLYAMVESFESKKSRMVFIVLGSLVALAGIAIAVLVWVGIW
jgi:hypothetical protein